MEALEIFKKHPIAIGAGVLVLVAVIAMRGSGSTAAGPSSGDVALQTNTNATNVQLAGISANAQVAMTQSNNALAALRSNNATAQVQTGAQLSAALSNSLMTATIAQINANANVTASNNALTTNLASIAANVKNHAADTAVQSQAVAANLSTALAGLNVSQNIAQINGDNAVRLSAQNGQNAVNYVNAQSDAASRMNGGDWISAITGGINSLTGGPSATNPGASLLSTFGGGGGGGSSSGSSGGGSSGGSGINLAAIASIAAMLFA